MNKRDLNIGISAVVMVVALFGSFFLFGKIAFFVVFAICIAVTLAYAIPEELAYRKAEREKTIQS